MSRKRTGSTGPMLETLEGRVFLSGDGGGIQPNGAIVPYPISGMEHFRNIITYVTGSTLHVDVKVDTAVSPPSSYFDIPENVNVWIDWNNDGYGSGDHVIHAALGNADFVVIPDPLHPGYIADYYLETSVDVPIPGGNVTNAPLLAQLG